MSESTAKAHRRDVRRVLGENVSTQMQVLINEEHDLRYDVKQMRADVESFANTLTRTRLELLTLQDEVREWHQGRWYQRLWWLLRGVR